MTVDELRASDAAVLSIAQTVDVLADIQGHRLDERTVRRACETGDLPCVRVGRRLLVPRLRLLALLESPPDKDEGAPDRAPVAAVSTATEEVRRGQRTPPDAA